MDKELPGGTSDSSSPAGGKKIRFKTVHCEKYCAIKESGTAIICTKQDFEAHWLRHCGFPGPKAPEVDFNNFDVIAIYCGLLDAGSQSHMVSRVEDTGVELVVYMFTTHGTLWQQGQPYEMIAVPKLGDRTVRVVGLN